MPTGATHPRNTTKTLARLEQMLELLADLDLLREAALDLTSLQMDGVAFAASTAQLPRNKITEVNFSPIVVRSRSGTNIKPEYFDSAGRQLSMDEVIDSVIDSAGIVHFASKISFKIRAGRVVGFALYGDHLRHFDGLKTYEEFGRAFGVADRIVENKAYGDLMGYDHYYFRSRKHVAWSEFDSHVSLINLGDYDGNDGPHTLSSQVG